jgi:hypothetical protein
MVAWYNPCGSFWHAATPGRARLRYLARVEDEILCTTTAMKVKPP